MAVKLSLCCGVIVVVVILLIACMRINYLLITGEHVNMSPYMEGKGKIWRDNTTLVTNSLYFTTTTLSSVGYGDILPVTNTGKLAVAAQQMLVLMLSLGLVSISC